MAYRAIYKCRLCGEKFRAPTYTTDENTAVSCMAHIVAGVRGANLMQPTLYYAHGCGGDHRGGLGLADFQGWEKEE